MTADAKNLGAAALLCANGSVPFGAVQNDMRHIDQGLDILYDRGLAPQSNLYGVRRLQPRFTAFPLQRLEHGRLFAADVSAGAAVHRNIEVETAIENVLAKQAILIRIGNRLDPTFDAQEKLAPDVNERALRLHGVGGNDDPFDDLMRIALDDGAILEGAWLSFVGIDRQITDDVSPRGHKTPFQPGGKTGAAAPTQARAFDQVNDVSRPHGQRFAHGLITAMIEISGNLLCVRQIDVTRQNRLPHISPPLVRRPLRQKRQFSFSRSSRASRLLGVRFSTSSSLTRKAGAVPHEARHCTRSSAIRPSGVVSPGRMPNLRPM